MANKEDRNFKRFVQNCVKFCQTSGLTTKQAIFNWLNDDLQDNYKGKASKWKIEGIAKEITESVCQEMNIRR